MSRSPRVDYDEIAPGYDSQPYRARAADSELLAYVGQRRRPRGLAALDVGCGTGNQLVSNRAVAPAVQMVGADRSLGMLRQARSKAKTIAWVQADAARLPFADASFDFVSCQFAFHHFADKAGALRAVFRALRSGGRFVLRNLCPQASTGWFYYEYFPEAAIVDLCDFWPPAAIGAVMEGVGFAPVSIDYEHVHFEQTLPEWLDIVRRRDTCSQLQAISDQAYERGVARLAREVADPSVPRRRTDHLCLVTVRGDKPG